MKDETHLFTVTDPRSRSHFWLAGMDWAPQGKQSVRLPPLARKNRAQQTVSGMGVHVVAGRASVRVAGRGRLPARHRRHHLFSLALVFCSHTHNGYGIYRLNSTDYVFLASINGLPAVTADKTGSLSSMQELQALFLSMNEPPAEGWDNPSSLDDPAEAVTLTISLSARMRQRCRVRVDGLRQQRGLFALVIILAGLGAALWWQSSRPPEEPPLTPEEIQARARAMFAAPPEPQALPHPWATHITVPAMLAHCVTLQSPAPSVLKGWRLAAGSCSAEGVSLLYRLSPGGTVEGFLHRSREVFGVTPVFNLKEGGREARIGLPFPDSPVMDEAVPDAPAQLMRVLSWFQHRQVMLNIAEVPAQVSLPGNSSEPQPVQDWKAYTFSFTGNLRPADLFAGMDNTGIRLTRVNFELNGETYSYTTEGQIYASTK